MIPDITLYYGCTVVAVLCKPLSRGRYLHVHHQTSPTVSESESQSDSPLLFLLHWQLGPIFGLRLGRLAPLQALNTPL